MLYDQFIVHASEDKDTFVRSLAEAIAVQHVEVRFSPGLRIGKRPK
jgi:hypothetical protein